MKKLIGAPQAPPGQETRLAHSACTAMGLGNQLGSRPADETPISGSGKIGGAVASYTGTPT